MNRVRDEVRRVGRRGVAAELPPERADEGASPLQQAIGHEAYARYQQGLARLRPDERRAVVGRLEFGLTYAELCAALGKPSPDSARMTVTRAVRRLASTIRP
jgi:DNA-directed RNA polymerase specialized sigma24 family protein